MGMRMRKRPRIEIGICGVAMVFAAGCGAEQARAHGHDSLEREEETPLQAQHAEHSDCSDSDSSGPELDLWQPAWPEVGVAVPSRDSTDLREARLTRDDGEEIRCALQAYMHSPRAASSIRPEFQERVARWRVGAPWLDEERPRIGEFWVQRGERLSDAEGNPQEVILLSTTLELGGAVRYGLEAQLIHTEQGWQVIGFRGVTAHRRR